MISYRCGLYSTLTWKLFSLWVYPPWLGKYSQDYFFAVSSSYINWYKFQCKGIKRFQESEWLERIPGHLFQFYRIEFPFLFNLTLSCHSRVCAHTCVSEGMSVSCHLLGDHMAFTDSFSMVCSGDSTEITIFGKQVLVPLSNVTSTLAVFIKSLLTTVLPLVFDFFPNATHVYPVTFLCYVFVCLGIHVFQA